MVRIRRFIYTYDRLDLMSNIGLKRDKKQFIGPPHFVSRGTHGVLAERSVRALDRDARPRGPSGSISRRRHERALDIEIGPARFIIEVSDHS
jgi:hypothetical protein